MTTAINILTTLLGAKTLGDLKEKKEEEETTKTFNTWVAKQEYLADKDYEQKLETRKYTEEYEQAKLDEKREYEISPQNLANIQIKKFAESQASFDTTAIQQGFGNLMLGEDGKKLPFVEYAPLISEKIVEKKRNDELKKLAGQAGIDITKPNWESSYQSLITQQAKGMTLEKQNQISEDSALRKLAQGVGINVSNPTWRTDYANFVKGTAKGMTLEEQEDLKTEKAIEQEAVQMGLDITKPNWKTEYARIKGGQTSSMTYEESEKLKNKIADAHDAATNIDFTLFKNKKGQTPIYPTAFGDLKVPSFVMPLKKGDAKLSARETLEVFDDYIVNTHFDRMAASVGGLQNKDIQKFALGFRDAYMALYDELRSKTPDVDFRPNTLVTGSSLHPYFKEIINRIHQNNNNLEDLFRQGAVLKGVKDNNIIPVQIPASINYEEKGKQYTENGHTINYEVVSEDEHETFKIINNEIEQNRIKGSDQEAFDLHINSIVGPRRMYGKTMIDTSAVGFYNDVLKEGFTMTNFRSIDPKQRTKKGNVIPFDVNFLQTLGRNMNEHFNSPLQAITALSVAIKQNGSTGATSKKIYAEQNGIDLEAHNKLVTDGNSLIGIVNEALTSVTDKSLNIERNNTPEAAYYLQVNGQPIKAAEDASDLFGQPLNFFATAFDTIGDQMNEFMDAAGGLLSADDNQIINGVKQSYLGGEDSRRWLDYSTATNKDGIRYVELEARRRNTDVDAFLKAEARAKKRNEETLNQILEDLNREGADDKARATAKKKFYVFTMAYKMASLLQGGTGGRTISDQDVENMFKILSAESLGSAKKFITSMIRIKKLAVTTTEMNQAILQGLQFDPSAQFIKTPNRPLLISGIFFRDNLSSNFLPTYASINEYFKHGELSNSKFDDATTENENLEDFNFGDEEGNILDDARNYLNKRKDT